MFRVASIVLLASLCSFATAQADKKMREPVANGTVNDTKEQASLDVKVLDRVDREPRATDAGSRAAWFTLQYDQQHSTRTSRTAQYRPSKPARRLSPTNQHNAKRPFF